MFTGVDRASYMSEADVSAPTASNDLRRLLDAGLVVQRGKGRNTRYVASNALREEFPQRLAGRSRQA
jgi:DNA-binding transcriptional ArsR family regulator